MHVIAVLSYRFAPIPFSNQTAYSARERAYEYATLGWKSSEDIYFLENEIAHLDDVSRLYRPISLVINSLAIISWSILFVAVYKKVSFKKEFVFARNLLLGFGLKSILFFFAFGLFFEKFHMILFPQGNWAFPADSLLILLFPEIFWKFELALLIIFLALFSVLYSILGREKEKTTEV